MIGIIISVWNCLQYTKRCVASIRTAYPYQIIIVDDGSTDGTVEWAKENGFVVIEARPPTVSTGLNVGSVGRNYNLGMRKAIELGFSHMVFAHNDILFHKDAINNLVNLYEKKKNKGYLFHAGIPSGGKFIEMGLDKGLETKLEDLDKMVPEDYVDAAFLILFIMTKDTFDRVGPFDEQYTDGIMNLTNDWLRCMDVKGVKYSGTRLAWFYHFGAVTTKVNTIEVQKIGKVNEEYYMLKWGGFWNLERFQTPFGGMLDIIKCPWECGWEGKRQKFVPHLLQSCPNYPPEPR